MANDEKGELHKTIWRIANDLRGSVDGWDFKQYVLGSLFYRFISENFASFIEDGKIYALVLKKCDPNHIGRYSVKTPGPASSASLFIEGLLSLKNLTK